MGTFKIITDSTCDLPKDYYKEHDLGVVHLSCLLDGVTYNNKNELDVYEFYKKMRNGSMPTTSQVNPEEAKEEMMKYIKEGREILYIAFSSGLSGSYQSAKIAADEILEDNPDAKIVVLDSLCASLGEGLMVHKAVQMRDAGCSLAETADYLQKHALNMMHLVTVDDLNHLYRGGRVSKATALVGTAIGIKPILHVNNEGKLINIAKSRGRKKSLLTLVDMMAERIGSFKDKNDIIFISHGDCEKDAQIVADEIKKRFGYNSFLLNHIGPVIGSHAGPGTVALFFWGDVR